MKTASAFCLLALALIASTTTAHAQTPATGADCITLSQDQQIVRKNADTDLLLRNGQDHYIVRFKTSCSSAARSPTLAFSTQGQPNQLCSTGSKLHTKQQDCEVAALEPISAKLFGSKARARR